MATARQVEFLLAGVRDPYTNEPLASGTVETYKADGAFSTSKKMYKTNDTTGTNWGASITLDANGRAIAYGGPDTAISDTTSLYDLIVKDSSGSTVFTIEGADYSYSPESSSDKVDVSGDTMTGVLNMGNNKITGLAAGTVSTDAVRYGQVVLVDGSNKMTGSLEIERADPLFTLDATSGGGVAYFQQAGTTKFSVAHDTINNRLVVRNAADGAIAYFDGADDTLNMDANKIVNVADPTTAQDAVTKTYADSAIGIRATVSARASDTTTSLADVIAFTDIHQANFTGQIHCAIDQGDRHIEMIAVTWAGSTNWRYVARGFSTSATSYATESGESTAPSVSFLLDSLTLGLSLAFTTDQVTTTGTISSSNPIDVTTSITQFGKVV